MEASIFILFSIWGSLRADWRPDEELVLQFAVQQIGLDIYALEVNRLSRELEREKLKTGVLEEILNKQ